MALESIKAEPGLASRVIAFNGRYASLPETASTATTIHLIHGGEDPVIDLAHAVAAQEALISAGGDDIVQKKIQMTAKFVDDFATVART